MADKYKIFIANDEDRFTKAIIALVDSGLLLFSRSRYKNLDEIIQHYGSTRTAAYNAYWLILGYTDELNECTRCIYCSDDYWNCLNEYKELELEELVRILKDGQ